MPANGAGSQRIIVIGESRDHVPPAPPAPRPAPAAPRPTRAAREVRVRREGRATKRMAQSGWTTRRLTIGGALGGAAVVLGGVLFTSKFGTSGTAASPFLAVGFGLFAIGMVVFCACLIALVGTGISAVVEQRGWAPAALGVMLPLALVWLLHLAGAVGYAIAAVISLVLIGGLIVALK
jgi:hypothetical protein